MSRKKIEWGKKFFIVGLLILIMVGVMFWPGEPEWLDGTWTLENGEFVPSIIFNRNEFTTVQYVAVPDIIEAPWFIRGDGAKDNLEEVAGEPYLMRLIMYGTFTRSSTNLSLTFSHGDIQNFGFSQTTAPGGEDVIILNNNEKSYMYFFNFTRN